MSDKKTRVVKTKVGFCARIRIRYIKESKWVFFGSLVTRYYCVMQFNGYENIMECGWGDYLTYRTHSTKQKAIDHGHRILDAEVKEGERYDKSRGDFLLEKESE